MCGAGGGGGYVDRTHRRDPPNWCCSAEDSCGVSARASISSGSAKCALIQAKQRGLRGAQPSLLSSSKILRRPHRGMYRTAFAVCAPLGKAVNASVPQRASQPVRRPGKTMVTLSPLVRQHAIYQKVTPDRFHQKSGLYSRKSVVHRRPVPGDRQAATKEGTVHNGYFFGPGDCNSRRVGTCSARSRCTLGSSGASAAPGASSSVFRADRGRGLLHSAPATYPRSADAASAQ